MKLIHVTALSLLFAASPVLAAMRVTNLDKIAHTLEITGNGAPQRQIIQPNDTEYFTGSTGGKISLLVEQSAATSNKGYARKKATVSPANDTVLHSDGMLSGIIGNERSTIPADPDNSYTIWPGGHISLQSRARNGGGSF